MRRVEGKGRCYILFVMSSNFFPSPCILISKSGKEGEEEGKDGVPWGLRSPLWEYQ